MKLQAGKTYIRRDGERVKIHYSILPFVDDAGRRYNLLGQMCFEGADQHPMMDLISLVEDAPEPVTFNPEAKPAPTEPGRIVELFKTDSGTVLARCDDGTVWWSWPAPTQTAPGQDSNTFQMTWNAMPIPLDAA